MFKLNNFLALAMICFHFPNCDNSERSHFSDRYLGDVEDDKYTEISDNSIKFLNGNWFFWAPWLETASSIDDVRSRFKLKEKSRQEYWGTIYTFYNDRCMFDAYICTNPLSNECAIGSGYIKDENVVLDYGIRVGMTKEEFSYSVCLADKYKDHLKKVSVVIVDSIVDGQHWEFHFSDNILSEIRIVSD